MTDSVCSSSVFFVHPFAVSSLWIRIYLTYLRLLVSSRLFSTAKKRRVSSVAGHVVILWLECLAANVVSLRTESGELYFQKLSVV